MIRFSDSRGPRGGAEPMRPGVAVVAPAYPVRSETFVYHEVQGLRHRGWRVTTVSLHDPPEPAIEVLGRFEPASVIVYGRSMLATLRSAFCEVVTHPGSAFKTLLTACGDALSACGDERLRYRLRIVPQAFAALGLARRLRPRRIGLIHCHFAHAPTTVGMYTAMQLGVPLSFVGHANDLYQRRVLLKPKLRRAAFVSCISMPHRNLYMQLVPREASAYPIIRCGVDTEQFANATDANEAREVGSSPGKTLLTVCRLVEKKGVDTLIRALAALQKEDPSWQLTIAGSGPDEPRLRFLAAEMQCNDAIMWLGPVGSKQVRRLMRESDMFVLPCREDRHGDRDGIPVVLMEAMASALPVIAGDIASIRDLVHDGHNGVLVPGDDVSAVARAIRRLHGDADRRARLAIAGRERVVEEFSREMNLDRLEQSVCDAVGWWNPAAPSDRSSIPRRERAARVGV